MEKKKPVTTMFMEEGLDTGDMILFENGNSIMKQPLNFMTDLVMGAELLIKTIEAVKLDNITPQSKTTVNILTHLC